MIEISRVGELDRVSHYPKEVQEKILESLEIFSNSGGFGFDNECSI